MNNEYEMTKLMYRHKMYNENLSLFTNNVDNDFSISIIR